MQKEIITFIFTAPSPADFTESIYKSRNILKKANGVVVHDIAIFKTFFEIASDDFQFRIIIHAEIADNNPGVIGESGLNFLGDLKELPEFKNIEIPFISRKKVLFLDSVTMKESLYKQVGKYKCFYTGLANDPDHVDTFIEMLPVFTKGVLVNELYKPGLKKGADFAVLTALYEDEFQIYKEHCDTIPDTISANCYKSTFIRKVDRIKNDYEKPFALIHQEQLGLVDAAIYSTQIMDKIDPRFLLMGGVCGGLISGVSQYDIIIPTIIYDYATGKLKGEDESKPAVDKIAEPQLETSYKPEGSDKVVKGKFESKQFKSTSEKLLTNYIFNRKGEIIQNMKELMPETQKVNFPPKFDIHIDEFACGPWVVKTDGFLDDYLLKEFSEQIKGLEMESYSVNRAGNIVQKYGRYSLVVKSVMDYTNTKKEDGVGGSIKKFAALMSFLCIRAMMPILLEFNDPKIPSE